MSKSLSVLLYILLSATFTYAGNEDGNEIITGKVITADGQPAASVTVHVKGTHRSTLTNDKGEFTLRNMNQGNYELEVSLSGYEPITTSVTAGKNGSTNISIVLAISNRQLQEVVVRGNKGKLTNKETDYVARMPLKNLENPQVYTLIPKELLKEQNAVSINSAMVNATGAAPVTYPAGGFAITSRGFLTSINARNGMETVDSRSSVDIGNVERIEVIKGPSGTLFGSTVSSFGGVVNLVTKKPFETFRAEAGYSFGSFGLNRFTADINAPLNQEKTALFRINTVLNRQNSFLNYGYNNSFLIAPSLSYQVNDRLTLIADMEFYSVNQTRSAYTRVAANSGVANPSQIALPYNKSMYVDDANAQTSAPKYFLEARYRLSPNWVSSTLFSFVNEYAKQSYQYYPTYLSPTTAARNIVVYGPVYNNYTNLQQNFNGTVFTSALKHAILLGVGYRFYHSQFNYTASNGNKFVDTINVTSNFTALNKAKIDQFLLNNGSMIAYPVSDQETYSAYATDVVHITDRLSTMLSLRVDRFDYKGVSANDAYHQTSLAPKLGLVYQLIKDQVSLFGNYMSGFQNNGPVSQPNGTLLIARPIYANQSEGGIKAETFHKKLNLTVSYYYIAIDNALRTDANGYSIQDAGQVSKGVEAEVIANPITGLNLIAGYAYNDNRIVKATDKTTEGNKAATAPANVLNFWISYKFQEEAVKNLGLGFGGNYVDKAYLNTANNYWMPDYLVLNGTLFYDQPKWRVGIMINNIGGRKSWDLYGAPQALRNFTGNLTIKL
jgi:iron complex outermembrane receptor protein